MLRIFAATQFRGRDFNKLVVFDEAHEYITESDLIGQVVETIREMRHQATTVVIASQDPLSVPRSVVELTSILLEDQKRRLLGGPANREEVAAEPPPYRSTARLCIAHRESRALARLSVALARSHTRQNRYAA